MRVLLELRPALDGHAGIPQETRLLFRGLAGLDGVQLDGLLQSASRLLARGLPADEAALARWPEHRKLDRQARAVISMQPGEDETLPQRGLHAARLALACVRMLGGTLLGRQQTLGRFDAARHPDFIWRALFAKTLPSEDRATVTAAGYRIARVPWVAAHTAALAMRRLGGPVYPRLDTRGYSLFIAETPYPGRVHAGTRLVVRYHDAVPLLMPHTIADRARHQASHYHALRRNVADGAWFACVSDASRRDLLSVFPEAEPRAVTIPNMVSEAYFQQTAPALAVDDILLTRGNRRVEAQAASARRTRTGFDDAEPQAQEVDYLLMVSTVEPRKNHLTLLAAWEHLRSHGHPGLRLVLVGSLGWDSGAIVRKLLPWILSGHVHLLEDVPAAELRLLYRRARATVCPSLGEGFGYSGVEAMRCGSPVVASALPVHREVYADAAEFFDPYAPASLAEALQHLLGPDGDMRRAALVAAGERAAVRYLPAQVLPQWQGLLERIARGV